MHRYAFAEMLNSFIFLSSIIVSASGQGFIRPSTTTTRSPVNSFTMPALTANERVYCEILKPQDSAAFLKGSGSFSLKLSLVKEGLVSIDITAENKTSFIGIINIVPQLSFRIMSDCFFHSLFLYFVYRQTKM